jgi:hypothetical protein
MKTTMSAHLDDYLERMAKLRPKTTVRHNANVLRPFVEWRDRTHKSAKTLSGWEVEDYLVGPDGLADRLAPGSWNVYKSLIGKFVRWGAGRGHWSLAAVVEMDNMQAAPKPKLYLSTDQMDRLMAEAKDPYTRFILAALRYTLCREQELLAVRFAHLNQTENKMTIVRTKGRRADPNDKLDRIPIPAELADELDLWLPEYEKLCGSLQNDWRLIPQRLACPAGKTSGVVYWKYYPTGKRERLGAVVKAAIRDLMPDLTEADLKGVGSHTLRRSGGQELRESLRDAGEKEADYQVMAMYGHATVETSYNYWGEDRDRVRRDEAIAGRRLRPKKAEVVELRAVEDAG